MSRDRTRRLCSEPVCGLPHHALGLCRTHYERHRYATDEKFRMRKLRYVEERNRRLRGWAAPAGSRRKKP